MQRDLIREAFEGDANQARIWRSTLAAMTGLLCMAACLIPIVGAVYDARLERDAARTPVTSESSIAALSTGDLVWTENESRPWYNLKFAYADELASIQILSFTQPGSSDIDPPPGVPRWPQPNEIFASESVLDMDTGADLVAGLGDFAGIIADDALADPGDRIIYVGIDTTVLSSPHYWLPLDTFGATVGVNGDEGYLGNILFQAPRTTFWIGLICFCIAPGILLTGAVLRLGSSERERIVLIARSLGGSTFQVSRSVALSLIPPIASGALIGYVCLALASLRDWTIPFVGFQLSGRDMRSGLPVSFLVALATILVITTLGVVCYRPWRAHTVGAALVVSESRRHSTKAIWITCAAVGAANWGYVAFAASNPELALYLRLLCVSVAIVALPAAMAPLIVLVSRTISAVARLSSNGALLAAGKELRRFGRSSLRIAAIAGMLVILGMQVQVITSAGNSGVREASEAYEQNNDRVLMTVHATATDSTAWLQEMLGRDHGEYGVLALTSESPPQLIGTCENLAAAFVSCLEGDSKAVDLGIVRDELRLYGVDEVTHVTALASTAQWDPESVEDVTLLYVSRSDSAVPRTQVISELSGLVQPVPVVEAVGQSQASGAQEGAKQSLWLAPAIIVAFCFALIAAAGAMLLELVHTSNRIRSMLRIAGPRDLFVFAAAFVGTPIVLVSLVGVAIGTAFVIAPANQPYDPATISVPAAVTLAVVGLLAGGCATGVSYLLLGHRHRNRPNQ